MQLYHRPWASGDFSLPSLLWLKSWLTCSVRLLLLTGGHYPKFKNVMPSAEDSVTTFRRTADLKNLVADAKAGKVLAVPSRLISARHT